VHKTANVLNKLPKSQQAKAKRALGEIWMAETKKDALVAFDAFVEIYAIKYEKAVECLTKDRDALLAFYDFPAEHWKHLRTSNPVESTFATVRHRTVRSKSAYRTKPLSPWFSSLLKPPRNIGAASMDKANCRRSFSE
jgi:putative transposase